MAFLDLNGIVVPCSDGKVRTKPLKRGRRGRSFKGALRDTRRGIRRSWDFDACFFDHEEGAAMVHLLNGDGHFIDCAEGTEAVSGLQATDPRVTARPNSWGAHGRGVFTVQEQISDTADSEGFLQYDAQLGDDWTVFWAESFGSAVASDAVYDTQLMSFYGVRSDQLAYANGVQDDDHLAPGSGAARVYTRVTEGIARFLSANDGDFAVDDFLIVPWKVPASWMATWTSQAPLHVKLPPLPMLTARGDFIEKLTGEAGGPMLVLADVMDVEFVQKARDVDGYWRNNAMRVRFTLSEVDPAYYCVEDYMHETVSFQQLAGVTERPLWWYDGNDLDGHKNASMAEADQIVFWRDKGQRNQTLGPGAAGRPLFRLQARDPAFRSAAVDFFDDGLLTDKRMTTNIGAGVDAPFTCLWVLSTKSPGTGTTYVVDGIENNGRMILRLNKALNGAAIYMGGFLVLTGYTPQFGDVQVGVAHYNGANSEFRMGGVTAIGSASGSVDNVKGFAIGGLNNADYFVGLLMEKAVWSGSPGIAGVPTLEQLQQYVIDKYLGGG